METVNALYRYLEGITPAVVRVSCPWCVAGKVVRNGEITDEDCAMCAGKGRIVTEEKP